MSWPTVAELGGEVRFLRELLWYDASTEYDARHLTAFLEDFAVPLSPAFWQAHARWAVEEEHHCNGFLEALEGIFGSRAADGSGVTWRQQLASRHPDVTDLADELRDEFDVLLAAAYDELGTVRAYRANLVAYDRLGPDMARFVRLVIADEARHYASFLALLRREGRARLDTAPVRLAELRARLDGVQYGRVFLFDHFGPEYTTELKERASAILLGQLAER
jgi:hypothetical protein